MRTEFTLPKYLRLLLLLYRKGIVEMSKRRSYGFTKNDVYMLEAHGLVTRTSVRGEEIVVITDKGEKWVYENIVKVVCG